MNWHQEFRCSRDQREGESISQELARVSTAMEADLSKWKQKVSDARKEYRELNFFNTQQLMLLRKEIARACHKSQFQVENRQVFTLLENVRPGLHTEHLMEAVQRAFKDTDLLEQAKDSTGILPSFSLAPSHVDSQESLYRNNNYMPLTAGLTVHRQSAPGKIPTPKRFSKIQRFLNTAENEGYSEQVALCALASLGVEAEEDDLLLWCLDESDDADLESLYDEAINNPAIAREMISEEIVLDQENEFEGSRYASLKILVYGAGKQMSFFIRPITLNCFVCLLFALHSFVVKVLTSSEAGHVSFPKVQLNRREAEMKTKSKGSASILLFCSWDSF